MADKTGDSTKGKIITAAWKLFYQQGYDETTIDEIVEESGTSKGSFYHYFNGKDALLSSLSYIFDRKYKEIGDFSGVSLDCVEKLLYLNRELFLMVENSISVDILARLLSSQLITRSEKHLLDHNRTYYKLLRSIVSEGQQNGELRNDITVSQIVKDYAMLERALMYDWCLCAGEYSLSQYSAGILRPLLENLRAK